MKWHSLGKIERLTDHIPIVKCTCGNHLRWKDFTIKRTFNIVKLIPYQFEPWYLLKEGYYGGYYDGFHYFMSYQTYQEILKRAEKLKYSNITK